MDIDGGFRNRENTIIDQIDITQYHAYASLTCHVMPHIALRDPRWLLNSFLVFRIWANEKWRGQNKRDAQKFELGASKSRACRLRQVVSGHWKRGRLVEGRTSYTVETSEQEGKREWFLSREMREPRNPSERIPSSLSSSDFFSRPE